MFVHNLRPGAVGSLPKAHLLEALPSRTLASISPAVATAAPADTRGLAILSLSSLLTLTLDREAPEVGDTPWSLLLPPQDQAKD